MKVQLEKNTHRMFVLGVLTAAAVCVAVLLLARVQWLGAVFCLLFAALLLLAGKTALLAHGLLAVAYAAAEWALGGHSFPYAALVLAVGMLAARKLLGLGYRKVASLEKQLARERQRHDSATLVSTLGQARNLRSYQNDAAIYLKLTRRYHLNLCVIFWRLENARDLHQQLGNAAFHRLIGEISSAMSSHLRAEDMVYMLNETDDDLRWGTLHIANDANVAQIVEEHMRKTLATLPVEKGLPLDFKVFSALAQPNSTPMSLLEAVEQQMNG